MEMQVLNLLYDRGILSELDVHFANFISKLAGGGVHELSLAAALVSSQTRQGHVCLNLERGFDLMLGSGEGGLTGGEDGSEPIVCPELTTWCEKLRKSPAVGKPGDYKPLILDDSSRLYLYRYWDYQARLADFIKKSATEDETNIDIGILKDGLERLFDRDFACSAGSHETKADWQMVAAFAAVTKRFCVITGGPGTGKTTTVAKILALIIEQTNLEKLHIALVAPTGKAAARLQEAIKRCKQELGCSESIRKGIPNGATTIHRLLGSIPGSPYFRHNEENPLSVDVVIVDEASMVDLAMMSKLVQALPVGARLILLGDKDQLASVEAGAVLGDICGDGDINRFSRFFCDNLNKATGHEITPSLRKENQKGIGDCIVGLQENFRFGSSSGISAASRAINMGDADLAATVFMDENCEDIKWKPLPRPDSLSRALSETVIRGFGDYLKASDIADIFRLFDQFRILCAVRKGPYGVSALNLLVEQILSEKRLIAPDNRWYSGRPILITSNDYNLQLFNGDVGLVLPDSGTRGDLRVFFPGADGSPRKFHPFRLPEHETVYAMTVHKSQGSEFDSVLLILPDREFPVLTRELVYTGITRARRSIEVWGTEDVLRTAVSRRIERTSGLRDTLWKA